MEDLDNFDAFFDYEPVLDLPTRRWRLLVRRSTMSPAARDQAHGGATTPRRLPAQVFLLMAITLVILVALSVVSGQAPLGA